jgi:enoyl-CoA hydratase/carnithine racemase
VARTKDIILLARLMDAEEMRAVGLLNEITAEDGLYARAEEVARTVASHAPLTVATTKEALNRIVRHWTPPSAPDLIVRAYTSEDFKEGIDAFLSKRKPRWTGK